MKTHNAPLPSLAALAAGLLAGYGTPLFSAEPAPEADDDAKALPAAVAVGDTVDLPFFGKVTVVDAVD